MLKLEMKMLDSTAIKARQEIREKFDNELTAQSAEAGVQILKCVLIDEIIKAYSAETPHINDTSNDTSLNLMYGTLHDMIAARMVKARKNSEFNAVETSADALEKAYDKGRVAAYTQALRDITWVFRRLKK